MTDIRGRENVLNAEGVLDLEPYLKAIPASDLGGLALLSAAPPAGVYRSEDGQFDHVLYPLNRSNVYLVIVVGLCPDRVVGHRILDLRQEPRSGDAAV